MVCGCISEGTTNAEHPEYIQDLEQHMLPSRQGFFQGRPCLFQQHKAKPPSAHIITAWLGTSCMLPWLFKF